MQATARAVTFLGERPGVKKSFIVWVEVASTHWLLPAFGPALGGTFTFEAYAAALSPFLPSQVVPSASASPLVPPCKSL